MALLLRMGFWGAIVGVLVLSLVSVPGALPTTGWDKTNHLLGFGVMAFIGYWAYPRQVIALVVGLLLFGIAIEGLQSLTPTRYAEMGDVVADVLGIGLGLLLARLAWPIRQKLLQHQGR